MLIDPPIDKLVQKVGCKYELAILVAERARFLEDKKSDLLEASGENSITYASKEVYNGKVKLGYED